MPNSGFAWSRRHVLGAGVALAGAGCAASVWAQSMQAGGTIAVTRLSLSQAARELSAGGWIMMMRHEQTVPGIGDPPNFRLDDCSTQRNLSDVGRARARRVGQAMRSAGIDLSVVRAGRWCRVRETAELAFGMFETWPALDSFFGEPGRAQSHRDPVIEFARSVTAPRNAVLVTHQVNITATLDVYPEMGEIVAARNRDGGLQARFRFNPASE